MSIPQNVIYDVSCLMEYSLDNEASYSPCNGGIVNVAFAQGNKVWAREIATPDNKWYLGEVNYVSGYPDLAPSNWFGFWVYNSLTSQYEAVNNCVAGNSIRLYYKYSNVGYADSDRSFTNNFYLSSDKTINPDGDILLGSSTATRTLAVGLNPAGGNPWEFFDFSMPSVSPGTYYIGCALDTALNVTELNEDNNISSANTVVEVIVSDTGANPGGGAVKLVNSWGTNGSWEKVKDGHYWVTYNTLKALQLPVFYYTNNFTNQYKPTAIAVFQITHPERDKCFIEFGLGDPANPWIKKEFQTGIGTTILSGALPFPANAMALDISEFAHMVNDTNVYLKITTSAGAVGGTVGSFVIKYYSFSSGSQVAAVTGTNGGFNGDGQTTIFIAPTTGACIPDIPPLRSVASGLRFIQELPSSRELANDMSVIGVYDPGKKYSRLVDGRFGTGFIPPSYDEWLSAKKLRSLENQVFPGTYPNQQIDHSMSQYFPPIGNQGAENSCVCYSTAYYIHTYTMAKEYGWNLIGTTFIGTSPGAPQDNLDKIMSPDFVYHQINQGVDNGSHYGYALSHLTRMGCCSWSLMPYSDIDHTSWPSEDAFMEAARYRASQVNRLDGYHYYGYFIICTDADVNMLKNMLMNGYFVTCAIDADKTDNGVRLYDYLDGNDVIDNNALSPMDLNHAQTIVGFKDGTMWDKTSPDD